uniref:Uncharacterized protein n=1 Tax=Kwoniella pini CBS 10737 TaxID=1296096 RepID=A0A1B9HWD4_9TREE|nr:uncharacterized protein I206_06485 [Kwoniella pini CBS 10737]OCF47582.1 hypothetical protein I206_06485 [Kwoniella pini CBS 10737]
MSYRFTSRLYGNAVRRSQHQSIPLATLALVGTVSFVSFATIAHFWNAVNLENMRKLDELRMSFKGEGQGQRQALGYRLDDIERRQNTINQAILNLEKIGQSVMFVVNHKLV